MNISENLKLLRSAKKLSQAEMAKLLGFKSHNAYSHWEVGKTSPNVRDLERLSEILGASVQYILFGENAPVYAPTEKSAKIVELETEIRHLKRENMLLQMLAREKGIEFPKSKGVIISPKNYYLYCLSNPKRGLFQKGLKMAA